MRKSKVVQLRRTDWRGRAGNRSSMTKTDTSDVGATVAQIEEMSTPVARLCSWPSLTMMLLFALKEIRKRVPDVPIVADIHFHYKPR